VSVVGTENYTANGNAWVRYLLTVVNRHEYPDSLFSPAPDLPPCGLNTNSSRTWVNILDQDDNYIYGFCALGSAEDLGGLWFAVAAGTDPPSAVRVILNDRLCEKEYRSELVEINPGLYSPPPTADLEIQSRWAASPPVIDGVASISEWSDAGNLSLYDTMGRQQGIMYVKNDDSALYILLDMTGDSSAGTNPNDDYSGIAFDIGLDGFKSPYVDLRYATAAGTETLGIQWVMSENGWTGLTPTSHSEYQEGFGSTISLSGSHKFFEYKLDFSEIGIDFEDVLANPGEIFQARLSVDAVSYQPAFSVHYPSHYSSFASPMVRVALDLRALIVGTGAPIISGIGLVPKTYIDQTTGLATTGTGHQIDVTDAPFGKHLRVIGNLDKLRSNGVEYYVIAYCNMGVHACNGINSGMFNLNEWEFVEDARTNYYWNNSEGRFILDSVSPDVIYDDGTLVLKGYPVPSGFLDWYFPNLLFDWRTTGTVSVTSGLYKMHLFGFRFAPDLTFVNTPDDESTMVVRIDNTYPQMRVNSISHGGTVVDACAIIRLENVTDQLVFNVSAYDPDGYLHDLNLHALYGDNQSFTCHTETYSDYLTDGGTGPEWFGAFPSANYVCQGDPAVGHWDTTCGYTFCISGWDRAINGYGRIHWNVGHKTITILMPDYEL